MIEIKNDCLAIWISKQGAEMQSILDLVESYEYLWQGQAPHWRRKAPVLFPIVGALKDKRYFYNDNVYEMGQHGFARDMVFELESLDENAVMFLLKSTEETRKVYPFDFELRVGYALSGNHLRINYHVKNVGDGEMYFSIGGHPGFNVKYPCVLEFDTEEHLETQLVNTQNGLIKDEVKPMGKYIAELELTPETFKDDALIFENLKSNKMALVDQKAKRRISMSLKGVERIGIWSDKGPFVCIEPWWGIADGENATGVLYKKAGIKKLLQGEVFECFYEMTFERNL